MEPAGKKKPIVIIDAERCKGCELCIVYCARKVLGKTKNINKAGYNPAVVADPDKCTACGFCYLMCPDNAIEIK
ncbi:MAG: hypothetical protein A2297_09415 [Elusimicrobia bacterium RIFOXYB2_FULL_48_7]|nr:MAG: hypothetical protein A2297_09415 [Elusimicrobia bacterium RIFOXYB2_FULL_48_7]